jgi:hypothetical protein
MARNRGMPFSERIRRDRKTGELVEELSLRERFPTYLKAFALGLVITALLGLGLFAVTDLELGEALGYSWIFSGTILLLAGGARGGGYSNLSVGALEAMVGGRNRSDDDFEGDAEQRQGKTMRRRDPMDRLRKGLRPPPNPSAFWQIVAGFGYIVLGLPFTF